MSELCLLINCDVLSLWVLVLDAVVNNHIVDVSAAQLQILLRSHDGNLTLTVLKEADLEAGAAKANYHTVLFDLFVLFALP